MPATLPSARQGEAPQPDLGASASAAPRAGIPRGRHGSVPRQAIDPCARVEPPTYYPINTRYLMKEGTRRARQLRALSGNASARPPSSPLVPTLVPTLVPSQAILTRGGGFGHGSDRAAEARATAAPDCNWAYRGVKANVPGTHESSRRRQTERQFRRSRMAARQGRSLRRKGPPEFPCRRWRRSLVEYERVAASEVPIEPSAGSR